MKLKDFFNDISIRRFYRSKFLARQAGIIKSKQSILETGRSMVEMLGVLAVIGVLSVTGIIGYKYAMTKYIANETINELNLRAHDISLNMDKMIEENYVGDIQMNMGPVTRMGYPITARVSPKYIDYFEIFIKNVPSDVCRELLRTSWTAPYSIFVGIQEYEASVAVCDQADEVDLAYEFYKDLTPKDEIDEDNRHETQRCNHDNNCMCGTCNTDHGLCEIFCLTNESCKKDYDDPRWMVCCDKNYIKAEYCCASITEDGQCCNREGQCCPTDKPLQDKNGRCHSCDDINPIELTNPDTCSSICPKRFINDQHHKRCILCGTAETTVENKPIWDWAGNCYACDDTRCIDGGSQGPAQEATAANCSRACPNRVKIGTNCCPVCTGDKPLLATDNKCYDCNDTTHRVLNTSLTDDCETLCPNRKAEGGYCVATCPPDKPLQDKYGQCHSCDDINPVELTNPDTCSVVCPKRFINDQYHKRCILCGAAGTEVENKPIWTWDGYCYACDDTRCIHGGSQGPAQEATAANCNRACPNRVKIGADCCPVCSGDTPLRGSNKQCYDCNYTGTADLATCGEACPNWAIKDGKCVRTNCTAGTFANLSNVCFKCNITTSVPSTEEECNRCINRIYENGSCKVMSE